MVRASILLDGVTAPVTRGRSIQERRNRASSSKRSPTGILRVAGRKFDCSTGLTLGRREITRHGTAINGDQTRLDPERPSKNSRTREKNPLISGSVSSEEASS